MVWQSCGFLCSRVHAGRAVAGGGAVEAGEETGSYRQLAEGLELQQGTPIRVSSTLT